MSVSDLIKYLTMLLSVFLVSEFWERRAYAQESRRSPAGQPRVQAPRPISPVFAGYPEGATGDATIVLELVLAADGKVEEATPRDPREPFATAARDAALNWEFSPALRDGVPVASKILVEVVFREPEEAAASEAATIPVDTSAEPQPVAPVPPQRRTEIVIRGERPEPSRTATLSRAEVRQIPGTFGDPFRAIETLPGVTPIVSGLPFFFVRGAPPGNVGYLLDGIRVPLLFHVGAGPSVIHPALVERVDLYPSGYPARFGRFAGGIVSGETTPPRGEFGGEFNLRLFDAGAVAEAPFAGGRGTALVGGRYSYAALLLSILSPETKLEYWDYQARLTYDLDESSRVGVFAFGSYDFLGEKTQSTTTTLFATQFHRVDLRLDRVLGARGSFRAGVTLGVDQTRLQQQDRSVRDHVAATRTNLEYRLDDRVTLHGGTDLQVDRYLVDLESNDLSPAAARVAEFFRTRTDVAAGAHADLAIIAGERFQITPGARVDLYGSQGAVAVGLEPRLSTRTELAKRWALLTTVGIAHQAPSFAVPVPGFQPGGLSGGLQRALQESAGLEWTLDKATTFTATAFQSSFFSMSDPLGVAERTARGCAPGEFPAGTIAGDFGASPDSPIPCTDRFAPGTLGPDRSGGGGQAADSRGGRNLASAFEVRTLGRSYGLELFLKRRLTSRFGGFLAYTLSRSTRSYRRRRFVASFDRSHVVNAAVAYNLGRRWRAGTRVMFYTGLPRAPDPTDPGATRLPPFFRLDLRLEKRWPLGKEAWLAFVAEWMNATLSTEAVTTSCTLEGCEAERIGPITIPSLGLEGRF